VIEDASETPHPLRPWRVLVFVVSVVVGLLVAVPVTLVAGWVVRPLTESGHVAMLAAPTAHCVGFPAPFLLFVGVVAVPVAILVTWQVTRHARRARTAATLAADPRAELQVWRRAVTWLAGSTGLFLLPAVAGCSMLLCWLMRAFTVETAWCGVVPPLVEAAVVSVCSVGALLVLPLVLQLIRAGDGPDVGGGEAS
jgi:hypothetical protein